jgi:hypothetical protein
MARVVPDESLTLAVECRPDGAGEPIPRRLRLGARSVEAAEILDRWPGHDHLYVKLLGSDGAVYILRHDRLRDRWQLVLCRAARLRGAEGGCSGRAASGPAAAHRYQTFLLEDHESSAPDVASGDRTLVP